MLPSHLFLLPPAGHRRRALLLVLVLVLLLAAASAPPCLGTVPDLTIDQTPSLFLYASNDAVPITSSATVA